MTPIITSLFVAILATSSALDLEEVYSNEELSKIDKSVLEEARMNFTELTTKYGYPSEIHRVQTEDGYIITIHRIPYGRACGQGKTKIPVVVQHGLFCSSDDFIILGPDEALAYLLADQCYDVWLPNNRGNKYSREHRTLNEKNGKYWEFSWHEIGVYDVPAAIDYILKVTGQPNLHYIGHSQGSTQFFVFASLRPEYQSKIRSFHAMSPVAFLKNMECEAVKFLGILHKPIHALAQLVGMHEFLPSYKFLNLAGMELCKKEYPTLQAICQNIVFLFTGSSPDMINPTKLPVLLGHTPAGSSTRQVVHYAQGIREDGFKQYDHGLLGNIFKYGSIAPPSYPVQNINIPTAAYYGSGDKVSTVKDVHRVLDLLPNIIGRFRVPHKLFGHLEFMWGKDVKTLLYDKVLSILARY